MKTIIDIAVKRAILIFTLILVSQIQLVMAKSPANNNTAKNTFDMAALAPVTPKEATFEDVLPEKAPAMVSIAPVTPKEATFDENDFSSEINPELLKKVAPETPKEADFNDASDKPESDTCIILFRVPLEANFIDF